MPISLKDFKAKAVAVVEKLPNHEGWTVERNAIGNVMFLDTDGHYRGYVDFYQAQVVVDSTLED